ncbi:MAG: HK97 family phage prohead protease [Croceibacterium sp.]
MVDGQAPPFTAPPVRVTLSVDVDQLCPPGWPAPPDETGTRAARLWFPRRIASVVSAPDRQRHHDNLLCLCRRRADRCERRDVGLRGERPMTLFRFVASAEISPLGDDQVAVVMSTAALARDGHILVPQGCSLENYRRNPIVLWQHSPDEPIGNAENITLGGQSIAANIRFAPLGISRKADEVRGLMKAGVIRAVSVGFDPIEMEPLDPKKPRGGQRISKWDLLELSAVSVPADTGAMVTARAGRGGKVLSSINAAALREAVAHADNCRAKLAQVLAAAGEDPDGDADERSRRRRDRDVLELAGKAHLATIDHRFQRRQRQVEVLRLGAL